MGDSSEKNVNEVNVHDFDLHSGIFVARPQLANDIFGGRHGMQPGARRTAPRGALTRRARCALFSAGCQPTPRFLHISARCVSVLHAPYPIFCVETISFYLFTSGITWRRSCQRPHASQKRATFTTLFAKPSIP